jgi:transcriptional regulator with XRE-family HTH domain
MSSTEIDSVRARLTRFRGRYPELCERSGLGYSWLSKFAQGRRGQRPSFELITKLQNALAELEAEERNVVRN